MSQSRAKWHTLKNSKGSLKSAGGGIRTHERPTPRDNSSARMSALPAFLSVARVARRDPPI